jgi:acetyl esterase/lipase
MLHGAGVDRDFQAPFATRVAELGFVVFAPSWGHSGGAAYDALTFKEQAVADGRQAACGTAFAVEYAAQYGGDPASLTMFGHSGGGMIGSVVVFASPQLSQGCLASAVPQFDTFLSWEADWLMVTGWDELLADDPSLMENFTPWSHLPAPTGLRFIALRAEDSEAGRTASGARGENGWLAVRDPDGTLTAALEENDAFADGFVGADDGDAILIDMLEAQGLQAEARVMPGSTHSELSDAGWQVFLDAFRELAARDES